MSEIEIRDESGRSRFIATVEGRDAVLEYRLEGDRIRLHHTGVPPELEGRGIGSRLARFALDAARERGLAVWPDCPFVASWIRRHPAYLDVVDPGFPDRERLEGH